MKKSTNFSLIFFLFSCLILIAGCKIYKFSEGGLVDEGAKTVYVKYIDNRAPYVNPQLSPNLSDRLRQKIVSQTKLSNINSEEADYFVSGEVRDYSVTTTGVTTVNGRQQSSINRLTVSVHIVLVKHPKNETQEFDVSRSFDFDSRLSLQAAESGLLDEMVRNLSDEIFNRIFSNW